jgi:hypothetical protein
MKRSWLIAVVVVIMSFSLLVQGGESVVKKPKLDTVPHGKVETATFAMG